MYLHLFKVGATYVTLKSFRIINIFFFFLSFLKRGRRRAAWDRLQTQQLCTGINRSGKQEGGEKWSNSMGAATGWKISDRSDPTPPELLGDSSPICCRHSGASWLKSCSFSLTRVWNEAFLHRFYIHLTALPLASPQKKKKKSTSLILSVLQLYHQKRGVCPNHVMCEWVGAYHSDDSSSCSCQRADEQMEGQVKLQTQRSRLSSPSRLVSVLLQPLGTPTRPLTSLESHILRNFSDPVHTFLSSEIVTAPGR